MSAVRNLCESIVVDGGNVACDCSYVIVLDSTCKSSYHNNNEGLLKVTAGHVRYTSADIHKTVQDSDIVTIDN